MSLEKKAREVFAFCEDDRDPECDWIDHKPTWCGDCYACADCGLVFLRITDAAREVADERKRIAARLIDLVRQARDQYLDAVGWDDVVSEFIEELEANNGQD